MILHTKIITIPESEHAKLDYTQEINVAVHEFSLHLSTVESFHPFDMFEGVGPVTLVNTKSGSQYPLLIEYSDMKERMSQLNRLHLLN